MPVAPSLCPALSFDTLREVVLDDVTRLMPSVVFSVNDWLMN